MWRAFFSAVGIVLLILGLECLVIDQAVLASADRTDEYSNQLQTVSLFGRSAATRLDSRPIFRPAEWIPWSLLATGAVTVLYSVSLRKT